MASSLTVLTPEEFTQEAESVILDSRSSLERFAESDSVGEALLDEFDELIVDLDDVRRVARAVSQSHPSAPMRAASEAVEQSVDKLLTDISLDIRVYRKLSSLDVSASDGGTKHYVFKVLRDFRRSGVDKDDATRARLREIREELVMVGQAFQRNINGDTRVVALPPGALDGLPGDFVRAHPPGDDGQVRLTTEYADFFPFMTYARDAQARERLWREFNLRGYPVNIDVLRQMLTLRREMAELLGYASYAQYVIEDKMMGTDTAAADFIARISAAADDRMRRDYQELLLRKQKDDPSATSVEPWDVSYLEDRIKAERFAFDSQSMRPYFEYGQVKTGLMAVAERLFGVQFGARPDIAVWHGDVDVYDVMDGQTLLGRIFLDMHPRKDKFSHAAMFSLGTGKSGRRLPECTLLCNFPGGSQGGKDDGEPALMLQSDVRTFFHEFGHLLHHVLGGQQRWAGVAGIKTEWDFAEAPSQLLEEWTRDAATLGAFARHHETGERLPSELVERMRAAEDFGIGMLVRRQMFYADLSLRLYQSDPATLDPLAVENEVHARHLPFKPIDGVWRHLSFGHLDGYSAIYYTYMWSLVIAKDLFTGFDPADLLASGPAARYRESVLAPGGSAPAAQLVHGFLGRDYTYDAFKAWLDDPNMRDN